MSDESIKHPSTSNNSLAPSLNYIDFNTRVKFIGSCFKHWKTLFTHRKTANIYIVYEINFWDHGYDDYLILENFLFSAVKFFKMLILINKSILDMALDLVVMHCTKKKFSITGFVIFCAVWNIFSR